MRSFLFGFCFVCFHTKSPRFYLLYIFYSITAYLTCPRCSSRHYLILPPIYTVFHYYSVKSSTFIFFNFRKIILTSPIISNVFFYLFLPSSFYILFPFTRLFLIRFEQLLLLLVHYPLQNYFSYYFLKFPVLAAAPDNSILYVPIFLIYIPTLLTYVLLLFSFHMRPFLLITIHISSQYSQFFQFYFNYTKSTLNTLL